jgi:hypothetical protein
VVEPFTYKAWPTRFLCGSENKHVQLINLFGPNGTRATAYSCSMNVDVDGEPQCYGPPTKRPIPRDTLQDAGYLDPGTNAKKRAAYEAEFPDTLQRLEDLTAERHAKDPPPDPTTKVKLDKEIYEVRVKLFKLNPFWTEKPVPVNNGTVFWKWYGVVALTPQEAQQSVYNDKIPGVPARHPELDVKPALEDVHGKYPVIQSKYEPGPGYYVSPISRSWLPIKKGSNPKFAIWDQRYWLPTNVVASNDPVQPPFGALSSGLKRVSGVVMGDQVLAIKRDTGNSLAFPFMDGANGNKVAECSLSAFLKLGGRELDRRHWDNNKFELLYLAFPHSQSPSSALSNFANSDNASDFPVLLAFLAGARGGADAVSKFKKWQELDVSDDAKPRPPYLDVIEPALRVAGFTP